MTLLFEINHQKYIFPWKLPHSKKTIFPLRKTSKLRLIRFTVFRGKGWLPLFGGRGSWNTTVFSETLTHSILNTPASQLHNNSVCRMSFHPSLAVGFWKCRFILFWTAIHHYSPHLRSWPSRGGIVKNPYTIWRYKIKLCKHCGRNTRESREPLCKYY